MIGALLGGRYRLDEQLASGGMAQVWRGSDEVLRRTVAIKVLHQHLADDGTFVTRFRHEAVAVARLSHPAIVAVYDTCSDNGTEAIVMELVSGHTLRQRLDEGPVAPWGAASIAAQVAGALAVAHQAGLVHRDIKPANILLSEDGRIKVGDFGIAKAAEDTDLTQEGSFLGTAKYLAPEQVEAGPVDGRTDLYSLGVVLYEMLCGRVPFEGDTSSATALARLHADPPRPRLVRPGVPRELEAITMRLLARNPDDRYPTATDLRATLLAAGADDRPLSGETVVATASEDGTPPGGTAVPGPSGSRVATATSDDTAVRFTDTERRWLVPTLLVVLVAVALGVAGLLIRGPGGDLFGGGDDGSPTTQPPAPNEAVPIASSVAFDPLGCPGNEFCGRVPDVLLDGDEHGDEAGNAIDGDPGTAWTTHSYTTPEFGNVKDGVGLILELDGTRQLRALEIDTPDGGWSAEVYVLDDVNTSGLEAWGEPVAEIPTGESQPDPTRVELEAEGSAVLVWWTRLSDNGQVVVPEVRLYS